MNKMLISDLHLEENRPEITNLFFKFLEDATKLADELYILGDFFETWIGDDDNNSFNQLIIQHLKNATSKGLVIYLMHGNRDFLIGKKFLKQSGCKLLPEEYIADLYGTRILLMHGDTLCTEDKAYLKFRKKARNWFFQKLFLLKPLHSRQKIAAHYREKSKLHTSTTAQNIMDVTPAEVLKVMQQHRVQHLIHGHTHRVGEHEFLINEKPASRTVLGAWHDGGSALVCSPDGKRILINL